MITILTGIVKTCLSLSLILIMNVNTSICRYPLKIRKTTNIYLHPHIMTESHLTHLTSLSPKNFWLTVQRLADQGLQDGKEYSIPSKVLLTLIRLRQGLSYEYLSILVQTEDKKFLVNNFYEVTTLFFQISNSVPRQWASRISEREKNIFFK